MGRNTEAKCRRCRREGLKLHLKGKRCESAKCPFEGQNTRAYPPGQHGKLKARAKLSTYGKGLREKQKFKRIYGILDKQFTSYFNKANRLKGNTADNLLLLIERRLDNVLFMMSVANSRSQARQLIAHGHVFINGHRLDIPSYLVKAGDTITFRDKDKIKDKLKEIASENSYRPVPGWLSFDKDTLKGEVLTSPSIDDIQQPLQMQLIVEIASR